MAVWTQEAQVGSLLVPVVAVDMVDLQDQRAPIVLWRLSTQFTTIFTPKFKQEVAQVTRLLSVLHEDLINRLRSASAIPDLPCAVFVPSVRVTAFVYLPDVRSQALALEASWAVWARESQCIRFIHEL